jgi:hypothetical protein
MYIFILRSKYIFLTLIQMFIYVMVGESWKVAEAGDYGAAVGTVEDAGVVLRLGAVVPADWNTRRRRLVRQQQGPQHTCTLTVHTHSEYV